MRSLLPLLLTCALLAPAPLLSQQLPRFVSDIGQPDPLPDSLTASLPFGHPADYRTEGMIAGAVLIGIPTSVIAFALCGDTDSGGGNCLTGGAGVSLLGFLLGGLTGALIGGAIPKARSPTSQTSSFVQAPNERLLQPGAAAGGVTARVAGSSMESLIDVAAGGRAPAAEAQSR